MSKLIRVDEQVHAALRQRAIESRKQPNDVLRQLLGLPVPKRSPRPAAGQSIPHPQFEVPILSALEQLGGSAPAHEVIERVGQLLARQLTDADRQKLGDGQIRWRLRCNVARTDLIKRGHLSTHSPRGLWEITDAGLERLRKFDQALTLVGQQQNAESAPTTARSSFASQATNEAPGPPAAVPSSQTDTKRSATRRR
ncbi:winged helix-turn-helix domain-containing protein [Solwaraspora sp. WMMB335]|uniref:winged helix-turn-helix domain-containing protein n=1 Tax=Solwaraspora sp. WMMB335 TaxID=3404118 RepID=UPI003B94D986